MNNCPAKEQNLRKLVSALADGFKTLQRLFALYKTQQNICSKGGSVQNECLFQGCLCSKRTFA